MNFSKDHCLYEGWSWALDRVKTTFSIQSALLHILVIFGYPLKLGTLLFIALSLPTHETFSALYHTDLQLSIALQGSPASLETIHQLSTQRMLSPWLALLGGLLWPHPEWTLSSPEIHITQIVKNSFLLPMGHIVCTEDKNIILHASFHCLWFTLQSLWLQ